MRLFKILMLSALISVFISAPAFAGGWTEEEDTTYLAWVRTELGTNTGGKIATVPEKNVLVYPGETIDGQKSLEEALAGTNILVVVLPESLQERVYPRVYAGWLLAREYSVDAVIVISGDEGGFESRFGWSKCHEILNQAGVALVGESTLRAVPGLKKCLTSSAPGGWEEMREKLATGEAQDAERKDGVFVSSYDGVKPTPETSENNSYRDGGVGLLFGLLIGIFVFIILRKNDTSKKVK